ncbi:MAG: hypothetical protein ACOVOF_15260 [Chryseotalea sp.]|jgi:hypothetical protein
MEVNIVEILCFTFFVIYLFHSVFQFVLIIKETKPTDPNAKVWDLKIFILLITFFLLLLNALLIVYHYYIIVLIIFILPIFLSTISVFQSALLNISTSLKYTLFKKSPILLKIENNSADQVLIKIDCLRNHYFGKDASVVDVFSFFVECKRTLTVSLSHAQIKLLQFKSHYVLIQIFKQEKIELNKRIIWKDIHPCFSVHQENSSNFIKHNYSIIINENSALYLVSSS